ncbi:type I inositol 1,4,5-trisphosphate 5-phosphatase CVP2-like protein [Carex littledalei]|uniref:Type I inositol 1,4,5-trisphosphate 5-phosphatase CVP2-like protein n=1 Tax=Carex littledalei TaxID=544730 RepID=A0A833V526_9POAL|nr:type I inositol 1,4,5-trisphosphate 5-phosphatase CVP2-like protein [Carex littledalei]
MRDDIPKKSKLSWSKSLVRKWFNIKSKAEDFHADNTVGRGEGKIKANFSDREIFTLKKSKTEKPLRKYNWGRCDSDAAHITDVQNYRLFVSTWNVGGKSPNRNLSIDDWLHSSPPADIYVLGFQEIVPLNAGNVLGTEDNVPAKKWISLIRKTLNKSKFANSHAGYPTASPIPDPVVELDVDFEAISRQNSMSMHRRSFQFQNMSQSMRMESDPMMGSTCQPRLERRFSVCDPVGLGFGSRPSDFLDPNFRLSLIGGGLSDEESEGEEVLEVSPYGNGDVTSTGTMLMEDKDGQYSDSRYCLVASKQMVGIFLTIWVRSEIRNDVKNIKVSCVGRGLMGYLGNKGSISISMSVHQTSFCFVCCHLTSGEKEGDELRRNSDVYEILKKTRFPCIQTTSDVKSPQTILEHDRVIWLGDLNYRVALSYHSAKALVEMHNWKLLLEKDQLRIERRFGRVFSGWKEGRIYFPPTYKYSNNSDRYSGDDVTTKEKRRTPAWCDRILWYGRGLNQVSYVRGESRFSDHRPVYSIFMADVEIIRRTWPRRNNMGYYSSRVEVEELLPYWHQYPYRDLKLYC